MTRSGALACIAICGIFADCRSSPAPPSGVSVFAAGRVSMTFTPQDQTFAGAAEAYRRLWVDEGSTIIESMERGTGLTYMENHVNAVVFEGPSSSGAGDRPMYLRASYPADVKKATLVHEHGHRLIAQLKNRPTDLDEHRVLFLFLYTSRKAFGVRTSLTRRSGSKAHGLDCTTTRPPGNGRSRSVRPSGLHAKRTS